MEADGCLGFSTDCHGIGSLHSMLVAGRGIALPFRPQCLWAREPPRRTPSLSGCPSSETGQPCAYDEVESDIRERTPHDFGTRPRRVEKKASPGLEFASGGLELCSVSGRKHTTTAIKSTPDLNPSLAVRR